MSVYKCKMCGGSLNIEPGQSIITCDYCGTTQTLPKYDDEKILALYDRANHFRSNNDFDKALEIYEKILNEKNNDAEAYWSIVLCRYGIDYVKDPSTSKMIPTVNRLQYSSILEDPDYLMALKYADEYQKEIYVSEANQIANIQNDILEISKKEKPFDVFICYKETDESGNRTKDSVLAQEVYDAIKKEGYKVFFSRITLEDKLGQAYEPYIFAALNSAKIMIVVTTNKDHVQSVWVKNEWSRYLSIMKKDKTKTMIPLYCDISPYDLPEEFSYLQAQDMSKIGYIQDLIRGIKKIIEPNVSENEVQITKSLINKGKSFLSSGEFDSAVLNFNTAKGYDPNNYEIYMGLALAQMKIKSCDELKNIDISNNENYKKAYQYANESEKELLDNYHIEFLFNKINKLLGKSNTSDTREALKIINEISTLDKKGIYYDKASGIKQKANIMLNELSNIDKQKRKKYITLISLVSVIVIALGVIFGYIIPNNKNENTYSQAQAYYDNKDYENAIDLFDSIRSYKDAHSKSLCAQYYYSLEHHKDVYDLADKLQVLANATGTSIEEFDSKFLACEKLYEVNYKTKAIDALANMIESGYSSKVGTFSVWIIDGLKESIADSDKDDFKTYLQLLEGLGKNVLSNIKSDFKDYIAVLCKEGRFESAIEIENIFKDVNNGQNSIYDEINNGTYEPQVEFVNRLEKIQGYYQSDDCTNRQTNKFKIMGQKIYDIDNDFLGIIYFDENSGDYFVEDDGVKYSMKVEGDTFTIEILDDNNEFYKTSLLAGEDNGPSHFYKVESYGQERNYDIDQISILLSDVALLSDCSGESMPIWDGNNLYFIFAGSVYDLLAEETNSNETYYLINTKQGTGYIKSTDAEKIRDIKVIDEYANVRLGPNTDEVIIDKINKDEIYKVDSIITLNAYNWNKITLKDGRVGYVAASQSVEYVD